MNLTGVAIARHTIRQRPGIPGAFAILTGTLVNNTWIK
jgi:hypothetical protein